MQNAIVAMRKTANPSDKLPTYDHPAIAREPMSNFAFLSEQTLFKAGPPQVHTPFAVAGVAWDLSLIHI